MPARKEKQKLKSYVKKIIKEKNIKFVGDSRGDYHIRFPLKGNLNEFNDFFKDKNIYVSNSQKNVSHKYKGYVLTAKEGINNVQVDTTLEWVNSEISSSATGSKIFATKDLSPDKLKVAGNLYNIAELINKVSIEVSEKYDVIIAMQLIVLLEASKEKNEIIKLKKALSFDNDDLKTISKDFGEILSAIWLMSKFNFSQVLFPKNSNEKFIDFFAKKISTCYPVSVKSGGGGKVLLQNILDAINRRNKKNKRNNNNEPAKKIIEIVNKNNRNSQMVLLHQYLQSQMINDLSTVTNIKLDDISIKTLENWLKDTSTDDLKIILKDWWKNYSQPQNKTLDGDDKLRFIISPLGEKIKVLLNENDKLKRSLNNLAHQVSLLQVNVDVYNDQIVFNKSFFKDSNFKYDWPGYSSGNKLGFVKE